jgi:RecG-like helicase
MLSDNAERIVLSQLHQLRGRRARSHGVVLVWNIRSDTATLQSRWQGLIVPETNEDLTSPSRDLQ